MSLIPLTEIQILVLFISIYIRWFFNFLALCFWILRILCCIVNHLLHTWNFKFLIDPPAMEFLISDNPFQFSIFFSVLKSVFYCLLTFLFCYFLSFFFIPGFFYTCVSKATFSFIGLMEI